MKRSSLLKTALKLLISFGALYLVFQKISPDALLALLPKIDLSYLLLALLFFNLSKVLSSLRLNRYFQRLGARLGEWTALKLYYIGMFYNLFLPGGIGGDGYKIYLMKKAAHGSLKSLVAATLLDRLSGLVPLLMLAALLFLISPFAHLWSQLRLPVIVLTLAAIPLFLLLQKWFFREFVPIFWDTLWYGFGVQLLQVAAAWAIFESLGMRDGMPALLFLFLLSSIAAVLPITIGGVGVRELLFLYGLGMLGLPETEGVAFAMLFFLITALSSLIGALIPNPLPNPLLEAERR